MLFTPSAPRVVYRSVGCTRFSVILHTHGHVAISVDVFWSFAAVGPKHPALCLETGATYTLRSHCARCVLEFYSIQPARLLCVRLYNMVWYLGG